MKKTLLAAILAALALTPAVQADRIYSLCDPFKSTLCQGLTSLYEFEEDSDAARTNELGPSGWLFEPDGTSLARTSTHKTGTYAFNHTAAANSFLQVPRSSGLSGTFTLNFWIYVDTLPSADTKEGYILTVRDSTGVAAYPRVKLYRSGSSTYVRYEAKQTVTDTVTYVQSGSALSASTWYMVTLGQYATPTTSEPYQQTMWMSINNGTRATATIAYPGQVGLGTVILGGWSNTSPVEYCAYKIDQLSTFGGVMAPSDVAKLYNSGSGKSFPFVD